MNKAIKVSLIAGMIGVLPTPLLAQHRSDQRGQPSRAEQARQSPARVTYREVTRSRGHQFRRGQRLAPNQRRYVVNDWQQRGLRTPPRGTRWVRENNNSGDYLLIAVATGLIQSILSQ